MMPKSIVSLAAFACALMAGTSVQAADVTFERLNNPDKEPQNWLMNRRDSARSGVLPLDAINKSNVKGNMRLSVPVALGGSAGNEALEGTPLVEKTASCTSLETTGASSTKLTCATWKSGRIVLERWTPARKSRTAIAASRSGTISSSRSPLSIRA
jgi:hypothetical protein